jgi:serine/threonine protein kinase
MEKALYQDLKFFLKYLLIENLMKISNFNENFAWLYHISPLTITFFIFQIIDGLKILYDCNYIHRDIKPENLLVAYQFRVKLCDFGILSKAKSNFQLGNGIWCYEGPEYYKDKRKIDNFEDSFKIDYYPIGLILYYIFFRDN